MKKSLIILMTSVLMGAGSVCAESVSSGVFGAYQIECPADSDTYISIPVTRPAEFSGVVESVQNSAYKIVAKGEPNWAANKFVYSAGTQSNYYYVKFTSGALEGAWFNVLSNSEYALELEIGEGELSKVAAGDSFEVIPHWSLSTLFPNGGGFTPNSSPVYGLGASTIYKYTAFENGKLVLPYVGKNMAFRASYYYRSVNSSWMNGRTEANDDIIEPNTFLVVRQPEASSATISVSGTVPLCATTIELATYDEISDQDNYIAVPAATDIKLSDLTAALIDSGIFVPTTSPLPIAVDSIYVYDNSFVQKNKAPSKSYFYRSTGNVGWYSGRTLANDDIIKAGSAILIRKKSTGAPYAGRGTFKPFYTE